MINDQWSSVFSVSSESGLSLRNRMRRRIRLRVSLAWAYQGISSTNPSCEQCQPDREHIASARSKRKHGTCAQARHNQSDGRAQSFVCGLPEDRCPPTFAWTRPVRYALRQSTSRPARQGICIKMLSRTRLSPPPQVLARRWMGKLDLGDDQSSLCQGNHQRMIRTT